MDRGRNEKDYPEQEHGEDDPTKGFEPRRSVFTSPGAGSPAMKRERRKHGCEADADR
jgi:hypothetical protein